MRALPGLGAMVMLAFGTACATIMKREPAVIAVDSDPPRAAVSLDGAPRGATPIALQVTRPGVVRLEREGYRPCEVALRGRLERKWVVFDVLLGVVPLVVDAITGRWYSIEPTAVSAVLVPVPPDSVSAVARCNPQPE